MLSASSRGAVTRVSSSIGEECRDGDAHGLRDARVGQPVPRQRQPEQGEPAEMGMVTGVERSARRCSLSRRRSVQRLPVSRYGAAAPGRGNCAAQPFINDSLPAPRRQGRTAAGARVGACAAVDGSITAARSLALGAKTPWKQVRCSPVEAPGPPAASRSRARGAGGWTISEHAVPGGCLASETPRVDSRRPHGRSPSMRPWPVTSLPATSRSSCWC